MARANNNGTGGLGRAVWVATPIGCVLVILGLVGILGTWIRHRQATIAIWIIPGAISLILGLLVLLIGMLLHFGEKSRVAREAEQGDRDLD